MGISLSFPALARARLREHARVDGLGADEEARARGHAVAVVLEAHVGRPGPLEEVAPGQVVRGHVGQERPVEDDGVAHGEAPAAARAPGAVGRELPPEA